MPSAKSFAETLLKNREVEPEEGEARAGSVKERVTAQAFSLRVRFKDGCSAQGFPWPLFTGYEWRDEGRSEHLALLFGTRVVEVQGHYLWRLVEQIDEGQLKALQEHDSKEVDLLRSENADLHRGHHKPVIMRIEVTPTFAEAVREIQGETHDSRDRAQSEGRGR